MIHAAARLHAFVHGLFRPSDEVETRELYDRVSRLAHEHRVLDAAGRARLAKRIAELADVAAGNRDIVEALAAHLIDDEKLFSLPVIDWGERRSVSKWWAIRDDLNRHRAALERFEAIVSLLAATLGGLVRTVRDGLPAEASEGDVVVACPVVHTIPDLPARLDRMLALCFDEQLAEYDLLPRLRDRLERNLIAASGGDPGDPRGFTRQPKLPSQADARDPTELTLRYLGGTLIADLFGGEIMVPLPTEARFEHHHIVAGSGHGKTQTLQYLIAEDLEAVARGERSVIVLDSQGDLIRNIARLSAFAPGGPLHDRLVLIDPTDVEYPVCLNLFDIGLERLDQYSLLDRERLQNSILELYDFVLGTLLAAEMTQKQAVIFRYVTRLMLRIPDATIHTLVELMQPKSEEYFKDAIAGLEGSARRFFETEFPGKEFEQTKKQVLRRLWGILENQTFERMFSHPRSKLDLYSEMNAGKVILINTAKDLLKETGTEIFGRFFIALIAQAAQERATLAPRDRMPTMVYIDEAADYFDRNVGIILSQARKYRVGMVLAHQYLGQLEPKLQDAFAANTAIKFAGGVSNKDARALAPMFGCDPALIEAQPKLSFAAAIRGVTKGALPLEFPAGHLEAMPQMDEYEWEVTLEAMRERYAVHYTDLMPEPQPEEETEPESPEMQTAPPPPDSEPTPETEVKPKRKRTKSKPEKDDPPGGFSTDASPEW